jgi:hypothetical protein
VSYIENDPGLPLVLPEEMFDAEIYDPVSAHVGFVNKLYNAGFSPDTLRDEFADLYLLDYYDAQVRNGGHSQFIHNSPDQLHDNLKRAKAATDRLDLPEMGALIDECTAFVRDNPQEAEAQDGFSTRAEALDPLDSRLYALKFDEPGLQAFLDRQPEDLATRLRQKLFPPDGAEAMIDGFMEQVTGLLASHSLEDAMAEAKPVLMPLLVWEADKRFGPSPSEGKAKSLAREPSLPSFPGGPEETQDQLLSRLRKTLERKIEPGLYDRSIYHIRSFCWLATHPDLQKVARNDFEATVDALAAEAPFAKAEKDRRGLRAWHDVLPDAESLMQADAFGQLRAQRGTPVLPGTLIAGTQQNDETRQIRAVETEIGPILIVKSANQIALHDLIKNPRRTLIETVATQLSRFKLMSEHKAGLMIRRTPQYRAGRRRAGAKPRPDLRALMFQLHLPEALHLWAGDAYAERASFGAGILIANGTPPQEMRWVFQHEETVMTLHATAQGVRLSGGQTDLQYSAQHLAEHRRKHLHSATDNA